MTFIILVAISSPHAAEDPVLRGYIADALDNHPALAAARAEERAAEQRIRVAGSWPDPELSLGVSVPPMERYMGDQIATVSLMQMLPAIGTRGAARDEARAMTAMQSEATRETRDRIVFEVRAAWYDLYAREADVRAAEEALDLLRSLERIALERYGAGDASGGSGGSGRAGAQGSSGAASGSGGASGGMSGMGGMAGSGGAPSGSSSAGGSSGGSGSMGAMSSMGGGMAAAGGGGLETLLLLRMELLEAEEALERARDEARVAGLRLNRLVGREPATPTTGPDTLVIAQDPREAVVSEAHPMLRMLDAEERALGAMERMNRRMGLPMIGVGVQYEYLRAREGGAGDAHGGSMLMPMVSVSLPLWRGKYSGAVREAALRREAAVSTREDVGQALRLEIAEVSRDLDDARRRAERFAVREDLTQSLLRIQLARQAAGQGELEEVLRTRMRLLEDMRGRARALADHNIAVARLERLTGGTP